MAKHKWILDESGHRDDFQLDVGYHNGPRCELCQESYCEHCVDVAALDDCAGLIETGGK